MQPPHRNTQAEIRRPTCQEILIKPVLSSSTQLQSQSEILTRHFGMHQPHEAAATYQVPSSLLTEADNIKRSSHALGSHHSHLHQSTLSKPSVETEGLRSYKTTPVQDHSDGVNFGARLWEDEVTPASKSSSESTLPHSESNKLFPVTNTDLHDALEVSESEDKKIPDLEQKLSQIDSQVSISPSELAVKMELKSTSRGSSPSRVPQVEMHWGEDTIGLTPVHKPSEVDLAANGKADVKTSGGKIDSEFGLGLPASHYPDMSPPASHHLDNTWEKSHHSSLTSVSTDISAGGSSTEES